MGAEKILEEYEAYRLQAEALQRNLEMVDASLGELEMVVQSLGEIKNQGKNNEILVPLGADSYVSSRIMDTRRVILGIGAGVAVKKPIEEAKKDLEGRMEELAGVKKDLGNRLGLLIDRIQELAPKVQGILGEAGREG
jgi:prefoldin alpha subunit